MPLNSLGSVWGRTVAVCVAACAIGLAAASTAAAQGSGGPGPDELWRAYPLEQQPTATQPATPAPKGRPASTEGASSGPPWIAIVVGAAAGVALGLLVAVWRRRRAPEPAGEREREREPAAAGPAPQGPLWRRSDAAPAPARHPWIEPEPPPAEREPAEVVPLPSRRSTPAAATRRPATPPKGSVCQIRWGRRGQRFYAFAQEPNGVERRLARSPRIEWRGPSPPDETPEARAALRELVKELREKGWRPLRVKGVDFDERRWYARRFRWPDVETQEARPAPGSDVTENERRGTRGRA